VEQEKNLLAAVLIGPGDQRERLGEFRRAIGLRFDEVVPGSIWNDPGLRALAIEIDELFRGRRDIAVLNATAILEDLQQRSLAGRFRGSLQQLQTALSDVIAWGEDGNPHPELEFTLACQLFQSAKARALFYPGLRRLLAREQSDGGIDTELESCRVLLNEATAITAGMPDGSWLKTHLQDGAAHMRLVTMGIILLLVLRFSPRGLIPER
jgi:hypothetical protein